MITVNELYWHPKPAYIRHMGSTYTVKVNEWGHLVFTDSQGSGFSIHTVGEFDEFNKKYRQWFDHAHWTVDSQHACDYSESLKGYPMTPTNDDAESAIYSAVYAHGDNALTWLSEALYDDEHYARLLEEYAATTYAIEGDTGGPMSNEDGRCAGYDSLFGDFCDGGYMSVEPMLLIRMRGNRWARCSQIENFYVTKRRAMCVEFGEGNKVEGTVVVCKGHTLNDVYKRYVYPVESAHNLVPTAVPNDKSANWKPKYGFWTVNVR